MPRLARALTFLLVVALAATLADWALTFSARRELPGPARTVAPTGATLAPEADTAPIAQMLGARPGGAGSIRLLGVIARGGRGKGIALLAVDGRPALAVRAGDAVA